MRTEYTTEPLHPVNHLGLLIQRFDDDLSGLPPTQSKTMGEIMSEIMGEIRSNVRRLPAEARAWLMWRFTRVL